MAVLRQSAPLRDQGKVAPWLYQIAVRQSLMYRRKHGRRRKLERNYAAREEAQPRPNPPDPLDWLIAEERRQQIRQAVQQLPPKDAELVLLKYTENWSYQQIADHLDTTASAVESRLHRARKKLRSIMASLKPLSSTA